MNKRKQVSRYLIADFLSAVLAWTLFYIFRKEYVEPLKFGYDIPLTFSDRFYIGLAVIPVFWILFYHFNGFYKNIYRHSRADDLFRTFIQSIFGVIILFFLLVLDDEIKSYLNYYLLFSVLFGLHFIITLIPRLILTTRTVNKVHRGEIGFSTLIIGSNKQAIDIYRELSGTFPAAGNKFVGFISLQTREKFELEQYINNLGSLKDLHIIIEQHRIEEVIIALESSEHSQISKIINQLGLSNVVIKAIPDMHDILTGKVKMDYLFGTPLIQLSRDLMPEWQANMKQFIDIFGSVLALIISSPLIIFLAVGVKLSSKGPVIYSHERIGRYGKPFNIYKFRSMHLDAEKNGPELSSKEDMRLTNFGRFMRKYRLDEIPNFINVLTGDMSLVGPRPERRFFIDQIVKRAPHYTHLHKVKPGITSWGQVKYGYAENVDQMILRLRYDILYVENMSLLVDFKIMFYTILTIFKGHGI